MTDALTDISPEPMPLAGLTYATRWVGDVLLLALIRYDTERGNDLRRIFVLRADGSGWKEIHTRAVYPQGSPVSDPVLAASWIETIGPDGDGAKSRTDRDAAPSGQRMVLPNTQGGADACPGLSDIAPAGLNLAPLGPEGDPALVCFFDSPNGQTCIRVTQDDDWHSQVLENPAHAGRLDSVVRTPQDLFAIQTVRDENPHIVSRCVKGGEWRILPSPSPTSPPSHLAIFDDRLVAGLDDEKRGFSLWWTKIPANGESPEWEPILLDGAGRTLMSGNLVSLGVRGSALDVVAGVTDPERAAFLQRTFKESRFDYLRVYADGDWDVVMGAPRFSVRGLRVPLANRSFEQWSNPHHPRWSAGAAGIFLCVDTDIGTQVMRSGDGETWEPAWSEFISGTFQRFAPQTIGQNPGGPVIVAETSDFSDHQVLQIWLGEPAHQISSPPAGLSS